MKRGGITNVNDHGAIGKSTQKKFEKETAWHCLRLDSKTQNASRNIGSSFGKRILDTLRNGRSIGTTVSAKWCLMPLAGYVLGAVTMMCACWRQIISMMMLQVIGKGLGVGADLFGLIIPSIPMRPKDIFNRCAAIAIGSSTKDTNRISGKQHDGRTWEEFPKLDRLAL
jgi:hypothetical protein